MLEINFGDFPVLETERFALKRIVAADALAIFEMRSDNKVMKYLDRKKFTTIDEAYAMIDRIDNSFNNNEGITWKITYRNSDALLGTLGLWRIEKEHHRAEIGYMLHHPYWSKGVMNEVGNVVLDYGFNVLNLHSIEGQVNPANEASIKLLEKLGFVREAYFRENYFYDGKFFDTAIYSLLKK